MARLGISQALWSRHNPSGERGAFETLSAAGGGLVALQASSRIAPTGELPTRILMMKWGENDTAEGPMTVGMKTLQASTLWDSLGFGEVAIDFNHNTCPGHPSYKGEPAKIAAVCTPRVGGKLDDAQERKWHSISPHFPNRDLDRIRKRVAIQNVRYCVAHIEHEHPQATVAFVRAGTWLVGRLADARDGSKWAINVPDDAAKADAVRWHL